MGGTEMRHVRRERFETGPAAIVREEDGRMKTGVFLALALIFAGVALLLAIPSGASTSAGTTPAPTIVSNQADYAPGSMVTLSGAGWGVGESVHIHVDDSLGQTWQYDTDVFAGLGGSFSSQFQLPATFIAVYS